MERTTNQSPEELQKVKIKTVAEGRELVDEIERRMRQLLHEMQNEDSLPTWQSLCNERYELIKARRLVQGQMGKIAAGRIGARNAI